MLEFLLISFFIVILNLLLTSTLNKKKKNLNYIDRHQFPGKLIKAMAAHL